VKTPSTINAPVFWSATVLILVLLAAGLFAPEWIGSVSSRLQASITDTFGWFYSLVVAILLIVSLYLAFSRYGSLKLGPEDAKPDYDYGTWVAMLFATGMGIGLLFFSVAEPIEHYMAPPEGEPRTVEAVRQSMAITFFHWGFHAWAIYAVGGLAMAYFAFRRGLPLTMKAAFCALFSRRPDGLLGNSIDVLTICATLFGIATSLGLGVLQTNTGLNYLVGVPQGLGIQLGFIGLAIVLTIVSIMTGLNHGLRRLSEGNIICAIALMIFVFLAGPTGFLCKALVENVGGYLTDIVGRTFKLYAYDSSDWFGKWTLFYWAWWISWAPFVGTFIARISRGRTIREFVGGVLVVPSLFCFLWMTLFGDSAIHLDRGVADGAISAAVSSDVSIALFKFLEFFPFAAFTSGLVIVLILLFFITHADSGALVIDMTVCGGRSDTPAWQRVYWCICIGLVAALMLASGGLVAVQTATLLAALPFACVLLLLAFGLVREVHGATVAAPRPGEAADGAPTVSKIPS
jgi:choline/glycine/proline betaine transport protein